MKSLLFACIVALAGTVSMFAACKQSDGERCQVDSDCESGVCNQSTSVCQSDRDDDDIDAGIVDAIPADAAVDAPPDAP